MQLSQRYPNLEIIATSELEEGAKKAGRLSFVLKDGKYIE